MAEETTQYGFRLLPDIADQYARLNPTKVHSYIPRSAQLEDGFRPITYNILSRAVNLSAQWLLDNLEARVGKWVIGFMGDSDLRSTIFMLAGIKIGVAMVLLNLYTPEDETRRLLKMHNCRELLHADLGGAHVPHGVLALKIPALDELLENIIVSPVPCSKSFEEAKLDVVAFVQTSGSTGRSKSIPITNERLSFLDAIRTLGPHHGRPVLTHTSNSGCQRRYVALDLAYMGGVEQGIVCPIFEGTTIVMGPTSIIPHELPVSDFCTIIDKSGADSTLAYPNVIERVSTTECGFLKLSTLREVSYIGGLLNGTVFHRIASQTSIISHMGSTETGEMIRHRTTHAETGYFCFNSPAMGIAWVSAGDKLFEPVIKRSPSLTKYQSVFNSFPDLDSWSTGDLYSPHATETDLWKYEGRRDDTIILNHGENIVPATLEEMVCQAPRVERAVLVGNGRPALALLLQLADDACGLSREEIMAEIWPVVEKVNATTGPLAKVSQARVLFARKEKAFVVTAKGGVSRRRTIELYQREIDALYNNGTAAT